MPADECIEGKYLLDRVENQAEFLKAMGGMKALYAGVKNSEGQTFGVTKHSEDKYTVQTGHARNTFTIGQKFQHQFMGGQGDFEGNAKCTSVMNHPEHNVLEKICDMPNGIQYKLWIVFTPEGATQHVTIGDMKAARVYKRVDDWTEEQNKLVGHVGDN